MDKKTKAKKTIPDTICRVHRSGGYAVLSNCFVRSTNIGCDSIGLLGKINDLPPTWNFTIAGLVAICEDGETAIKSQLAELEQWGYVKKTLVRYGITLALQFILVGQSRIKGGNEVLGGLS